jgi:hypothetical protein
VFKVNLLFISHNAAQEKEKREESVAATGVSKSEVHSVLFLLLQISF